MIEVSASGGPYNESVDIDGPDSLTLRGVDDPTVVGDGTGSRPLATFHVDDGNGPIRNVAIEGFTVRNPDGKFGIFAGTGTTNSNPDGIGGLVVRNNVVEDISTNSTGGSLTGGPAGIGIRGDYGTDGNPGIEISDNEVKNVQTSSSVNAAGITLKSFTGDAGFGRDSNGDSVSDPSSPPATDTDIRNNDISDIAGGGGSRTKGISVSGEFEDVLIKNNSITDISSSGSTTLAITLTENGGSFSGNGYDIDDDGNGERIGPRNFVIERNDIDNLTGLSGRVSALFIGGYEDLGDDHDVHFNNFLSGAVSRIFFDQDGFQEADADVLSANCNYWGHASGPDDGDQPQGKGQPVFGEVDYRPWSVREIGQGENPDKSCVGGKNDDRGGGQGN
ncbi:hypothetical protein DJ74_15895 [Halorubrum sp. Ea8]|nr:hypothetical protein DJ74_15895 [Halorubrum sp. Ea8]